MGHGASVSSRPYESCKKNNGWPSQDAPSELVQLWHKTFPTDYIDQAEMKNKLG